MVPRTKVVTIAATLSAEVDFDSMEPVGVQLPAAWTTANLTFQGSTATGGTFNDIYDSGGTELSVTVAASRYVVFTDAVQKALKGVRFVKVRSGTTATPVTQGASRTLTFILR